MAVVLLPYQHFQWFKMFSLCLETTASDRFPLRRFIWISHFSDKGRTQANSCPLLFFFFLVYVLKLHWASFSKLSLSSPTLWQMFDASQNSLLLQKLSLRLVSGPLKPNSGKREKSHVSLRTKYNDKTRGYMSRSWG